MYSLFIHIFPECVVKGSRFTFGGLGVDPCSRDPAFGVRNRPQPFATVCNRPQPSSTVCNRSPAAVAGAKLPCLWEKSQKRDFFDVSEAVVMSFCVAGVALCDIPTCFTTRPKVVLCGRCNTFATCSKDLLHFSWQGQHFGHLRCHFAWQAQHFRHVVLAVCFLRIALSALREVVTRCKFRGRRGTLLHSTCVRCKTVVRLTLPSYRKSRKSVSFFDVSEAVLMSFCVAGVALCYIPLV